MIRKIIKIYIKVVVIATICLALSDQRKGSNNVCKNLIDYLNYTHNENCFFNSDFTKETPGLVEKYIGQLEKHTVTTEDGYILKMFRIPRKNPKGVVMFQHSAAADSRIWVGQGNNSLAFYLWRNGYDIWMNNHRGTLWSQKHQSLPVSSPQYWNFSFHEVGVYDIPRHSFGATSGLIYGSAKSQEAKESVKGFIFLATPCYFKYATSVFTEFVPFLDFLEKWGNDLQLGNVLFFLPIGQILKMVLRMFPFLLTFVNFVISVTAGKTPEETDPLIVNLDFGIYIKALSFKIFMHYLQLLSKKTKFDMYDYGEEGNWRQYNSSNPPSYPLQNFSVPIFFISSIDDNLTTLKDTDLLLTVLPKDIQIYGHYKISTINHVQYFVGKHREIFYEKLLNVVDKMALNV